MISKLFEKNYVRIVNDLDNEVLFFHCKSKDDDLSLRNLQSGENWEFSFHINFFETTLFFYNFWYTNSKIKLMGYPIILFILKESMHVLNTILTFGRWNKKKNKKMSRLERLV